MPRGLSARRDLRQRIDARSTVKVKGKKASINADLGAYGAVDLKVKQLGAAGRGVVPKGCTGTAGKSRSGTLGGSFRLVADSTCFATVSASPVPRSAG